MRSYEHIHLPWQDWKIVNYLGSGTYGRVYEIERNIAGIQEKAALKIISRPKDSSEIDACYDNGYDRASIIESFEKEIQSYVQEYNIMKELQGQSNIVSCDDFAVVPHEDGIGGDIFLRMELLTSLPQILRQQMLSEQEIIKLGKDISQALMLCESKNIIHRDIKPVNIMVSRFGDYKLGDFGVSKIMDHVTYATAMGTPEYQAPEVVHMEKYGKTADIYSLGITLYWLLNNRKMPFIGADQRLTPVIKNEATDRRYRGEQLPPPRDGSTELKQIVLKACAYRPQERYKSAEEMNQALECIGNGQTTVRSEQQFCDKTVGPDRFCGKEFTKQMAWEEEDYGVNQTAGNSWGASYGTIGKTKGSSQEKRQTESRDEEECTATIGVGQAEQKQQQNKAEVRSTLTYMKGSEKKDGGGGWLLGCYLLTSIFSILFLPEEIGWINRVLKNADAYNAEYMLRKSIVEIIMTVVAILGLFLSCKYKREYGEKNGTKIGVLLIIVTILFFLLNLFEEFCITYYPGEKSDKSAIIVLSGIFGYGIVRIIQGLKRQKQ